MNYPGIILLASIVILIWIVAITLPMPTRESFSSGFTLKYHSMTTQTDPEPEVVPPMPKMAFENTEVQCDHGVCERETVLMKPLVPEVILVPEIKEPSETYERTREMIPPRQDGRLELDWFRIYPKEVVTVLNSNPFRV
jgi:hypothetical protein